MIPRHTMKAFADVDLTHLLSVDLDIVSASGSFARGNENNQHQPDGLVYLGPGRAPGYAVANLGARLRLARRLQLVAQVNNVFDRHYYTAAQLGPAALTSAGTFAARALPAIGADFPVPQTTFFTPAAPRLFWIGTRIRI